MRLKRLLLKNFRNHKDTEIQLNKKGAFFYGTNGAGKSNILEALYMFAYFKSFRSALLQDMIMWDHSSASLSAVFQDRDGLDNSLQLSFTKKKNHSS